MGIKLPPPTEGICHNCTAMSTLVPEYSRDKHSNEIETEKIYYRCSKCGGKI